MHAVLQQVYEPYRAELTDKAAEWCQLHPGQDERLWSTQELIEHLVLTCRSSSRALETRLQRGKTTSEHSSPIQWFLQNTMLSLGRMPQGAPAPLFARPGQLHWLPSSGSELLDRLREEMDRMDGLIDACRQRFGLQRVAAHFLLGPLRPDQWRRYHVIHFRHHFDQLRRLEKSIARPAASQVHSLQA